MPIINTVSLSGSISASASLNGNISSQTNLKGELVVPLGSRGYPYEGEYTVTPAREAIVLETLGKEMERNITVNPIPQNYGLITWDGSIITVS